MVEKPQSWREMLKRIISDTQERRRIARAMDINTVTLVRWASSNTKPRLESLLQLLETVPPQYTFSLSRLIAEEYPQYAAASETRLKKAAPTIPAAFYARVLNTHANSHPNLHDEALRTMILQQMLAHFAPTQQGLTIALTQCMPPREGQNWVRSLRQITERATPYKWSFVETRVVFMGAESPIGRALKSERQLAHLSQPELEWLYSYYRVSSPGSFVVTPLLRGTRAAGCLCLFSPEPGLLMLEQQRLILAYTELLSLSFTSDDFFPQENIELSVLPMPTRQQATLDQFQQRVTQLMLLSSSEGHSLTRPQAERLTWQKLEAELLVLD